MKTFEELTDLEKSVLLIWGRELNYSTTAHYPKQRIEKRLKTNLPGILHKDLKRINKTLISSGFITQHPARRNTTYSLSIDGLKCCNILKNENDI